LGNGIKILYILKKLVEGEIMRKSFFPILVVGMILLLAGCAGPRIVPRPTEGSIVDEKANTVTQEKEMVLVSIKPWQDGRLPVEVYQSFIPFYLTVKNNRPDRITCRQENFLLLDEKDNQYHAFSFQEVNDILYEPVRVPPPFSLSIQLGPEVPPPDITVSYEVELQRREARRRVALYAFKEGDIYPGAQASGYIFFPRKEVSRIYLIILMEDPRTKAELELKFEFDVLRR